MATILVVDDEDNIRKLVEAYLTAEGHTVHCAADGTQVLRLNGGKTIIGHGNRIVTLDPCYSPNALHPVCHNGGHSECGIP